MTNDLRERRKANLEALRDEKFEGNSRRLAAAIERSPSQLSQWFTGVRTITEESARHIEVALRLPAGWLDGPSQADIIATAPDGSVIAIEAKSTASRPTPMGDAYGLAQPASLRPGEMWLPQYEGVRAMMGAGSDGATSDVVTLVRVTEEGLRRRLIRTTFTSLGNLKLLSAYGDSMAGTFEDGDVILVDTGVREIDRDGVYVYSRDGELQMKRLQREDDGSLTVISDNPRYRDRRIAREDRAVYQVHGRALLAWTARVL